jgi:acyl-CoA dehydrogenase
VNYFFDTEHVALRDDVRRFAEHEVRPRVQEMEARRAVELELPREIAGRGWIGVTIPRRYGGMDLGHLAKTLVIEELSRVSGAMGAMVQASQLGVAKVLHFGTERQKARPAENRIGDEGQGLEPRGSPPTTPSTCSTSAATATPS